MPIFGAIVSGVLSMLANSDNTSDNGLSAGIKSALSSAFSNKTKSDSDTQTNGSVLKNIGLSIFK